MRSVLVWGRLRSHPPCLRDTTGREFGFDEIVMIQTIAGSGHHVFRAYSLPARSNADSISAWSPELPERGSPWRCLAALAARRATGHPRLAASVVLLATSGIRSTPDVPDSRWGRRAPVRIAEHDSESRRNDGPKPRDTTVLSARDPNDDPAKHLFSPRGRWRGRSPGRPPLNG